MKLSGAVRNHRVNELRDAAGAVNHRAKGWHPLRIR